MVEDTIVTLISNVGFPICMCLVLIKTIKYIYDQHVTEINALRETIDKNTDVLERLVDRYAILSDDKMPE